MRVLNLFTVAPSRNGITMYVLSRAKRLKERGIEVEFACFGQPDAQLSEMLGHSGMQCVSLKNGRHGNKLAYLLELRRLIRKNRYDAVHCHGSSATLAMELLAAKLAFCRVRIAHSHNTTCTYVSADRKLRPLFYRLYTHAAACGTAAGEWLFPGRKYRVLPNSVELDRFIFDPDRRERTRKALGLENAFVIGHVGRINPQKNHAFLLETFREILSRRPDARLVVVGDGPMEDEIHALTEKMGLSPCVTFTGSVENVEDYLCAMDKMLLPSHFEGFPTVLVEWQCAGLPVLVSDRVTSETAVTGLIRFLSLDKSAADWAEALLALPLPVDRQEASLSSKAVLAEKGFALQSGADALADFYLEAVKR